MTAQSDFSGVRELHLAPVYGARAWSVGKDGSLFGLVGRAKPELAWTNGENVARCAENTLQIAMIKTSYAAYRASWLISNMRRKQLGYAPIDWEFGEEEPESARAECGLPFSACRHGFYAYFTPTSARENSFAGPSDIEGVIAATGRIDVGTKGFRAERAEVKALYVPPVVRFARPPKRPVDLALYALGCISLGYELWLMVTHALRADYLLALLFACLAVLLMTSFRPRTSAGCAVMPISIYVGWTTRLRKMRRKYPSVRIFSDRDEMYRAFPLSVDLADSGGKKKRVA